MSTYEISKSSLLSLKAEILRKQQELSKARAENEVKIRNLKKNSPLDLKNKGVEQRQTAQDLSEEEENLLKKSKEALEAKSQLYDKLSKGSTKLTEQQAEYYRRYLVRFDKKSRVPDLPPDDEDDVDKYPESEEEGGSYEPPKNPDEEWVEYVDCLGRTRTCLRKDLNYLKSKDKDLELIVESKRRNREKSRSKTPEPSPEPEPKPPEPELSEENELLSSDMRREILRRQWEKEEEELRNKQDIHYQDILFNEARSHGVGYYGFSKDEEVRAKQQEALKKLREETKQQQKKSQELKAMREKQLASRVRAAQNRKRARLGLPPLEDEPAAPPEPEKPPEKADEVDEKEKKLEKKRKSHVRPWDIGKEGVKEHYEYSQEEWVDKKRRERQAEFAPPSAYKREYRSTSKRDFDDSKKSLHFSTKNPYKAKPVPIVNELSDDEAPERGRGAEVAPPPIYDAPSDSKRMKKPENINDSIEAGLKYLREQLEKKQTQNRRANDMFLS
ncbi:coiled-coil domain-containing protein 174 [Asbolus verrucosus]|uniref:Coiled-coil domain-containing protein 174 n=1 Tax=Asbolus verrucosus TaxID=1661398 RepID=A0A482VK48_ASBVE|nr:coiled-coil domain-containing protein 174 [Asbolus verrucosus]